MLLAFLLYSISVATLHEDFAMAHASFMLMFGVFKAGGGFFAISTGQSALSFVLRNGIARGVLALTWVYIAALYFDAALTVTTALAIPIAVVWLRSFDGHVSGDSRWSLINALLPSLSICVVGFGTYIGNSFPYSLINVKPPIGEFYTLIILLLGCAYALRDVLSKTIIETLSVTVSPLVLLTFSSLGLFLADWDFIIYRAAEGVSQLCLFVLSSSWGLKFVRTITIFRLNAAIFFGYAVIVLIHLLLGDAVAIFSGYFIFAYYMTVFYLLKISQNMEIGFVVFALVSVAILKFFGFLYFTVFALAPHISFFVFRAFVSRPWLFTRH